VQIAVYLAALAFAAMGIGALVAPRRVPRLFGVDAVGEDMVNEVRAVYGGFGCAMAVLLVTATQNASLSSGVVLTVAVSLLGMAAGRVTSFALSGKLGFYPGVFLAIEVALGFLLLWAGFLPGPA